MKKKKPETPGWLAASPRIAETATLFLLVDHSGIAIRRFTKRVWTLDEVRAYRRGYVVGLTRGRVERRPEFKTPNGSS